MRSLALFLFLIIVFEYSLASVSNLTATFRKGKTYITFSEEQGANKSYNIYRSENKISGISGLTPIANVPYNSGYDARYGFYHIVEDLGSPLSAGTGLFVYTPNEMTAVYYAVTVVADGVEDSTIVDGENSLNTPLSEEYWQWPGGVLRQINSTQYLYFYWMDYFDWNHNYDYYGHLFTVAVYPGLESRANVPIVVTLHGAGDAGFTIPYAGGSSNYLGLGLKDHSIIPFRSGSSQTWWYGFSNNYGVHDSLNKFAMQIGDTIVGYTEMRILYYVQSLRSDSRLSIDTNRIYISGGSMGGSGTLIAGFHNPDVWAAIRPNIAIVNYDDYYGYYASYPNSYFDGLYGKKNLNLTARNGINIYNWMDVTWIAEQNISKDYPPIVNTHGSQDAGMHMRMHRHLYKACAKSRHAVWGKWYNGGHQAYNFDEIDFLRFKKNELYPVLTNASQDDNYGQFSADTSDKPIISGNFVDADSAGMMNAYIDWTSSMHDMGLPDDDLIDSQDSIAITLISGRPNTAVDITPRRIQYFPVVAGRDYSWRNVDVAAGNTVASGTVAADEYGLVTIPQFAVSETGSRLVITCEGDCSAASVQRRMGTMDDVDISVLPNPFNAGTTIILKSRVVKSKRQRVDVGIYSIDGKKISELPGLLASDGVSAFMWNAQKQVSGVYLIKAKVGDKVLLKKIALVK
ncbi:MAG: hypothetical protein A2350_02915 [Candidatus Raymondbacteria bacterium RifOxyB12_full_50_8]|uniref:Peptidase S9 prolyl oligopeptidase catalytic domain-containing protein n=1 Tax=Candidatus Raymondbacteria bacterium RIFOXYD12_FULL_49_13 TaxID=1817890 RepID=A0A1F7FK97_UNCRA|nr:MAG: hypothetical protein A2248_09310 [Candidatus Raymondbacteria bacterium RIFOXYA2_FULL_49_16]OGJ96371.1 MAG: hypothetical protein A2453_08585 [Candidatus Raymondbacteria bacterium RIFOXYC2_FULL_50_21]OGK03823.1 MAG: hypothetical protein A2350_02915 [Candidatus Raymondbacteria bacterium RifOxyB12_full_50_8]OGK06907.1 MAG: hypothetical protein A2519_11650 [Candidatus Raymondbacteria bacterium RIFOXYD12_FULL_49_13]OGP44062.1 MAG: hypothetical protein A2324_14240 [Candidatus Raymondbacteria b